MRIKSFEFTHIKSYRHLSFNLDETSVLIGQNDHGKSSILKAIDIVLNQLDENAVEQGVLHPDLAERLLPVFPVKAKARRITIRYGDQLRTKHLHITVRANLTFVVHEKIAKNIKTTPAAVQALREIRSHNKFVLIPALRDASSADFQRLFSKLLRDRGLATIIPQKAGGTPKEYRKLRKIRDDISDTIKPFIDEMLLPQIEKNFGFKTEHNLAFKFDADVQDIGRWILDNLRLGFQLTDDEDATIALAEAGTGVQSVVLLALQRLEHEAATTPEVQFILAVEEPEAFLHPQKQRELYQSIRAARSDNFKVIVTTHSPYIVADTPFSELGLVKKQEQYSTLHTPLIFDDQEGEMFNAYGSEVNNLIFFADKVVLVEGESDARVIKLLLQKKLGAASHKISVISASGNKNFSPFVRMIDSWLGAHIPYLIVTDFDSLSAPHDRPILRGLKDAQYKFPREQQFLDRVDDALDKGEAEYAAVARDATKFFDIGLVEVFVFTSDLEYSLITTANKDAAARVLNSVVHGQHDYTKGYDLASLRRLIGSKGIPLSPNNNSTFKKPFIHRKIAETIDFANCSPDITRLIDAIIKL